MFAAVDGEEGLLLVEDLVLVALALGDRGSLLYSPIVSRLVGLDDIKGKLVDWFGVTSDS